MRFILLLITLLYADMQKIKINIQKEITIPPIKNENIKDFSFSGKIKIKPFYIGKYEVTKKEYNKYLIANHLKPLSFEYDGEENEPITNIDFYTAKKVCKFYGGRLPTNEEWIVAASIKLSKSKCYEYLKKYSFSPFSITKKAIECFKKEDDEIEENEIGKELLEVEDSYENINGTYGMYGNVFEWVDKDVVYFNKHYKLIKGGSFASEKVFFDSRVDAFEKPDVKKSTIGFRCVWDNK